jgi:hypothetical protein
MAKTVNVVVVALKTVVTAASNVAGSSSALTAAACHALVVGAHVSDVITAVQAGYEEKGQDLPQGMSSNLKRLAACDNELITAVGTSGYAMNNKLLELFKIPKLTNRGATTKTPTKTANSGAAVDPLAPTTVEHAGPITAALVATRTMMAECLKWQENGAGLDTAQVDHVKDHLSAVAAVLAQAIEKAKIKAAAKTATK